MGKKKKKKKGKLRIGDNWTHRFINKVIPDKRNKLKEKESNKDLNTL